MELSKKGWLKDYFNLKSREFDSSESEISKKGQHPEHTLYSIIQPSGLMYGYPVHMQGKFEVKDIQSKIKLVLMDNLLYSFVLLEDNYSSIQFEELEEKVTNHIVNFYNTVYPESAVKDKSIFGKKRDPRTLVEKVLERRIKKFGHGFWESFFNNSMLFLDIYFFKQWVQTGEDKMVGSFLKDQREKVRFEIVKVMAAAAHSNENIEEEEANMFKFFLESLEMSSAQQAEANEYFEKGVDIDDLDFVEEQSWIMKKYLLELAILTIWADKKVEDMEMEFLKSLREKLNFSKEEFEYSLIAIEGFVLEYWDELDKLKDHQDYVQLGEQYVERLKNIVSKNTEHVYKDIYRRGNLVKLLRKAKTGEISDAERKYITEQLILSLETIPSVELIALPKNFLDLDYLMKLLPQDFFKDI